MRLRAAEVPDTNLNLIPIMNLFTALIPFLLLSAAFYQLAIIKVSIPVASETGETDVAKEEDKITLTVRILPDRFEVSAASDTLGPSVLKAFTKKIPRNMKTEETRTVSYASLTEHAFNVKSKYTASDTVVVVPDRSIPFQEVVATTDALRDTRRVIDGQRSRVTLFPRVVLSTVVR